MRSWKRMSVRLKLAVGATVILALTIVGAFAAPRLQGANHDDAVKARETGANKAGDDAKAAAKPLTLGTVAKISANYRVAVTKVVRYEVPEGLLLAVTLDATYVGKENGEPWDDLMVEFAGSRSRTFGESDCPSGLEDTDSSLQPPLGTGDEATYAVCIGLPDIDVTLGRVFVEEGFTTRDRISWSTKEAVTKKLPPSARKPSGTRTPTAQPQRPPATSSNRSDDDEDDFCEEYEEDVEEYQENIDDMDERMDAYEDLPDHDDDEVEEYEEWKDAMEKNIERYEESC